MSLKAMVRRLNWFNEIIYEHNY